MSNENFALLQQSFQEVLEHVEGKRNDLRTTTIALPAPPKPRSKASIVALRQKLNYSQSAFARVLNVSPKTVQAWEQGLRSPSGVTLKLLAIAEKHPEALMDI
ncbi:MAG: helix-turn-helix domain-containing protein [Acidobacteria bacterium]|nr:helix-turn-helix domain-containing protein [Acidobacteriota bacterium]